MVVTIDFHVTAECSQDCPYCWGPRVEQRSVDTATARQIVQRVADLGIRRIVFTGGDPLLRPDIGELLDLARGLGLEVALSTTGDALTRAFLDAHAQAIDLVSLPLDGPSEEVSRRTKKEGHFAAVLAALTLLADHPRIDVKVATPVTRLNLDAVPAIVALLEERRGSIPNRLFYNVFQAFPRAMREVDWAALLVTDEEFARLRDAVTALKPSFPVNWLSHEALDRLYVMIFPDGTLTVPSGADVRSLGAFLDIEDFDGVLARTDFDAPKHALHAKGWGRGEDGARQGATAGGLPAPPRP